MLFSLIFLFFAYSPWAVSSNCLHWFLENDLTLKGADCEKKCKITPVDMATFSCPDTCDSLCSKDALEHILTYMPRLTEGDKKVISKYPVDSLKVYLTQSRVNDLSKKIFNSNKSGDESDAFRHFVWSGLLLSELGRDKAVVFLEAHEQDSTQSTEDKAMDIENNKKGLLFSSSLKDQKKEINIKILEKEALKRLRNKNLTVDKYRFDEVPRGYYSE